MDMCVLESHIGFMNPSVSLMQSGQLSDCQMGNHIFVLDEQIGLIFSVCSYVHLESKYIFHYLRTQRRHERKYFGESPSLLDVNGFRVPDSSAARDSPIYGEGTMWDLFMWNNITGYINLERLREPLSENKGGYIISHPPGTGKNRLTICQLVIIAPSSLLLNWEAEFQKWKVDIPFYNLNNKDFSSQEEEAIVLVFGCLSHVGRKYPHLIISVLGINYDLFTDHIGDDGDGNAIEIREILLKLPGLLVLEKGHIAQNEQSLLWQALRKVETEKRILFQTNIKEFYSTLSIKWVSISNSIYKNARALEELRDIASPIVHTCS
ncbi:hypothetical protein R3W88_022985 [Solanum pinnatisectum]|uniref:SNF2 N-terminal domain-containing protein n=1 Tax=Solanum pinnatisectum TaxID=50273 RepID=A0AAV9LW78_9SOLN|nr:hypothetical protein R3W88_022985 [Solanum pinnatisectum]